MTDNDSNNIVYEYENPFDFPQSLNDNKWKWRQYLERKRSQNNEHMENHSNDQKNKKKDPNKDQRLRPTNTLKFGCPLHDLRVALSHNGFHKQLPSHAFCNQHCNDCFKQNSIQNKNQFQNVGEWSFEEVGIDFHGNISQSSSPLIITTSNNNTDIEIIIDIWRYDDGAFGKKFRPGSYEYDGDVIFNQKKQNNKLGSWKSGKAFFILENDTVLLPIDECGIYLQFIIHSEHVRAAIDTTKGVIGGVGLSLFKNARSSTNSIVNCLLLRAKEDDINKVLSKSKIQLYSCSKKSYSYVAINGKQVMVQQIGNEHNNKANFVNHGDNCSNSSSAFT